MEVTTEVSVGDDMEEGDITEVDEGVDSTEVEATMEDTEDMVDMVEVIIKLPQVHLIDGLRRNVTTKASTKFLLYYSTRVYFSLINFMVL